MLKITAEEYKLLTRIMFLLADNHQTESTPEFGVEMNVDVEANEKEIRELVDKWQCLP